jgi:hypothetical protein
VAHHIWTIERISSLGMCKDSAGHQALKANSYHVEMSAGTERLNVEVAVTHVASRYAMDCLRSNSANDEANVEAVEQDLVRCFVDEEVRDVNGGWDPWKTPWLTIDSEDVQEIVECLTCLAAAE